MSTFDLDIFVVFPPGHRSGFEAEQSDEGAAQLGELRRRKQPEPAVETREGDRLDLLKMKDARVEEREPHGKFPAVAAHGRGVRDDDDGGQFVVRRIIAEDERGPDLGGKAGPLPCCQLRLVS